MVSRQPSLVLPLACRIPGAQVKGPQYNISMPTEKETFGELRIWIEFHLPGEGPLGEYTRVPKLHSLQMLPGRLRREAESSSDNSNSISTNTSTSTGGARIGSRIESLYLQVLSNCSITQAEMIVSSCIESETADFAESYPLLEQGSVNVFRIIV